MAMKVIGILFIAFGVIDFVGSWVGLDVWGEWIGIELSAGLWTFSAYIEIGIGYLLIKFAPEQTVGSPIDLKMDD